MAAKRYNYRNNNPVTFTRGGPTNGVRSPQGVQFAPSSDIAVFTGEDDKHKRVHAARRRPLLHARTHAVGLPTWEPGPSQRARVLISFAPVRTILATFLIPLALFTASCGGGEGNAPDTTEASTEDPRGGDGNANLIKDPLGKAKVTVSFEQGSAGWVPLNGSKLSLDSKEAYSGKSSLSVVTAGDAGFEGAETRELPVTPETTYLAVARVNAPKGASLQLALREQDGDGNEVDAVVTAFTGTGNLDAVSLEKELGPKSEQAILQIRTGEKAQKIAFTVDGVALAPRD